MKTLRKLFNLVATFAVAMFVLASCTTDNTRDESVFVPFDIDFSTGEALWDANNQGDELVLNKLGVGNDRLNDEHPRHGVYIDKSHFSLPFTIFQ